MVVLAASICTRGGKAVLSRQFREMPKSRIEGLLTSFPKLTNTGTQHTTVETDTIRYVYQPLEEMYMVLITSKRSNILQDIETLHLFAQVVTSVCRGTTLDEREIARNAFELLSAFDEIVCLGYRENLTLPQVKNILEMESHEEKIQEIIARNKEHEASEERKRRARQLEMQRREMAKFGPRQSGGFASNFPSSSQYQSVRTSSPDVAATSHYDSYKNETSKKPSVPLKGKGMQLGKKANTKLYDALSGEIASVEAITPTATPSTTQTVHEVPLSPSEGIQIAFSETMSARTNRDGGLEAMEIQGQLNLQISDSALSRIQLALHASEADGTQFKTHPNVDRNLFKDHYKIGLRDASKPFPLNQKMSVLRWRLQAKPNSVKLPISVNSWPSPLGDGTTDVSIEYEVDSAASPLEDVVITIPMPIPGVVPVVKEIDGDYQLTAAGFEWRPPVDEVENGRLEFNVSGDDAEGFFPVEVRYKTAKTVCPVEVGNVTLIDLQQEVPYASVVQAESVVTIS